MEERTLTPRAEEIRNKTENPLPWYRRPGGAVRYKKEMVYLREQLEASVLNAQLTRAQEVIFEVQSPLRPGLTFYLKTGLRYPNIPPELVVEKKGQQCKAISATLQSWSVSNALYEICLDAKLATRSSFLIKPFAKPLAKPGLVILANVVAFCLVGALFFFLLVGNKPSSAVEAKLGIANGPVLTTTLPSGSASVTLPYGLRLRTITSQLEYQNLLVSNNLESNQADRARLFIWLSQPFEIPMGLRFINQTTGRVRYIVIQPKRTVVTLDPTEVGFQSGNSCQIVIIGVDGNNEYSEPLLISRFNLDNFYVLNINLIGVAPKS
ncbi:MAG: hypothetical protein WCS37_18035 [Chloroflexota bacterium]